MRISVAILVLLTTGCFRDAAPPPTDCEAACKRMADLDCEEAKPVDGASCVEVCTEAEASGFYSVNPKCRATVEIDEGADDACAQLEERCK